MPIEVLDQSPLLTYDLQSKCGTAHHPVDFGSKEGASAQSCSSYCARAPYVTSDGWVQKLMCWLRVCMDTHLSSRSFLLTWRRSLRIICKSDNLIINVDETPLYVDMPWSSTITKKDAREVQIWGTRGGKKQVTYVVSCSAAEPNAEAYGVRFNLSTRPSRTSLAKQLPQAPHIKGQSQSSSALLDS